MQRARVGRALVAFWVVFWAGSCVDRDHGTGGYERIVSLVPAATESLLALGEVRRLVGRALDDPTRGAERVPASGTVLSPDTERIADLDPDLVLVAPESDRRALSSLQRSLGIRVEVLSVARLGEVVPALRRIGALLDRTAAADALSTSVQQELDAVAAAARSYPTRSVLWVVSGTPFIAAGPGTLLDDLGTLANLRNVLADSRTPWPSPALEVLVARDPEVVLWAVPGHEAPSPGARSAPWHALTAVREGRVVHVDTELFLQPGPRVGSAARVLLEHVHHSTGSES